VLRNIPRERSVCSVSRSGKIPKPLILIRVRAAKVVHGKICQPGRSFGFDHEHDHSCAIELRGLIFHVLMPLLVHQIRLSLSPFCIRLSRVAACSLFGGVLNEGPTHHPEQARLIDDRSRGKAALQPKLLPDRAFGSRTDICRDVLLQ
jgi:hypothetical protein